MKSGPRKYTSAGKRLLVWLVFLLVPTALLASGCSVVLFAGMPLVYDTVPSDGIAEYRDERYFDGPGEEDEKTRLDLFFPEGEGWPVVMFVPGGGWDAGDKDLKVGGKDVYRNIGRFLAANGVGAAVINYRLLPGVHWTTQIRDVARAALYVRRRAAEEGGDEKRLFLSGHSAGAQLVSRITLDESYLEQLGSYPGIVCGVVAVSGAGYDMEDTRTYALGGFSYFQRRFSLVDKTGTWPREASVVQYIDAAAPPFLVVYGSRERLGLRRQSTLFASLLEKAGVPVDTVVEKGYNHPRMVLALSRPDKQSAVRFLDFVRNTDCSS